MIWRDGGMEGWRDGERFGEMNRWVIFENLSVHFSNSF